MQPHQLFLLEWALRLLMALIIIRRKRAPSTALAWLAVVSFVPVGGAIAYLLVGENRLGGRWSRAYRALTRQRALDAEAGATHGAAFAAARDARLQAMARLAEAVGADSSVAGGDLQLLAGSAPWRQAVVAAIDAATADVHLLYFIFNDDATGTEVGEALLRAAGRGVTCRLMVDAVGSRRFLAGRLRARLQQGGVAVLGLMPVNPLRAMVARLDLRNHRKLAVLDGKVAVIGSHNVADPIDPHKVKYGPWVDASVRLTGPAALLLQEAFLRDWTFWSPKGSRSQGRPPATSCEEAAEGRSLASGGPVPTPAFVAGTDALSAPGVPVQILLTGPHSSGAPLVEVIVQAISDARSSVTLTTPYFVPDEAILAALRSAALRGIEVVLIVPRRSDHWVAEAAGRSHYGYLLEVGVAIHEYHDGLLHAKTVAVDDAFAIIGSANLDVRSFVLNFEMALLVYDAGFATSLRALHRSYLAASQPVELRRWQARGSLRVLGDNVAKLLTPLL